MANCNCGLSPLRKPCPRAVFDCRRCLSKMKNTGHVWQIETTDNLIVETSSTPIISVAPFSTKLYWDMQLSTGYFPDEIKYEDIRCVSGIWAQIVGATPVYNDTPSTPVEGIPQMGISLYFERRWRLVITLVRYYGGVFIPGIENGFSIVCRGYYDSSQDNCFILSPAEFTLTDTTVEVNTSTDVDDPPAEDEVTAEFAETILFQHVNVGDFDPNPRFPAT